MRTRTLPPLVFRLTKPQLKIYNCPARFRTVVAGRRFGKTWEARAELCTVATRPKTNSWYIAPTYKQAKELMWKPLKEFLPRQYIAYKNETDMTLELVNGSVIALKGADNPDSLRGSALDFALFDEAAFQRAYVWDVVRPALSDKQGAALFITTPAGYNWFYDLCMARREDPAWEYLHFTTLEGGNVPQSEIEDAMRDLDPRMFRQEYEASFESLANRVYYAFDLEHNVVDLSEAKEAANNPATQIHVGMDFNINPMSASLALKTSNELLVFGEITIPSGNTEMMAKELRQRFPKNTILVYPDPTGKAKHTSAEYGTTDFTILQRAGITVLSPNSPYPMKDKINTVNAALCNAKGERRVLLDRYGTKSLQKSLMGLTYVEGSADNIPDKRSGLDHIADALAYMILWLIPMGPPASRVKVLGV